MAAGGNSGGMAAKALRRSLGIVVLLAVAVAISACGWVEWPPPRGAFTMKRPSPTVANPPSQGTVSMTAAGAPEAVTVDRGDSVYGFSRKYGIPVRSIIEANNLNPPYHLLVGQRIALPATRQHVVKRGETIYSISRIYGVDSYTLASANGLTSDAAVQPGQSLKLPAQSVATLSTAPTSSVPTVEAAPISVTPLPSPALPGTTTASPPGSTATVFMPSDDPPPAAAETAPTTPVAVPPSLPEPASALAAVPPAQVEQPRKVAVLSAPPRRSGGFAWPVSGGKVVSGYGPKGNGLHNDGINIEAPRGAPIRAAENGVVAYAGNEIRGFGNMLLIKHDDGWVTAYAHADQLLVKRGDQIKKGDVIARVGSTGNVDKPQVHFELRQGKRAVDPQRYLGEGSVSRAEPLNPVAVRDVPPSPG